MVKFMTVMEVTVAMNEVLERRRVSEQCDSSISISST